PTVSPASSADMAPISSGSSTWTSAGLPFSFVSMATGMGPPSSGGQATVASVVTSTLLAGLGFSGSVISSLPGSFWPTHSTNSGPTPTQHPATPAAESTPSDSNIMTSEDSTEANNKQEEDREREEKEEEEEEEKEEEEEQGEEEKKKKGKDVTVKDKKQDKTVAQKPTAPVPTSKHRERGRERADVNTENSTMAPTVVEEQVPRATERPSKPTWLKDNDTADMQLPSSSTETTKLTNEEKAHWPYFMHT
ncbi:hypothetical protein M9458_014238, partial [Cirrhinus mrigala]